MTDPTEPGRERGRDAYQQIKDLEARLAEVERERDEARAKAQSGPWPSDSIYETMRLQRDAAEARVARLEGALRYVRPGLEVAWWSVVDAALATYRQSQSGDTDGT